MGSKLDCLPTTLPGETSSWKPVTSSPNNSSGKNPLDVLSITANYLTLVDEVDANTTYVGKADIGSSTASAVWQIKKIAVSGSLTTIAWADGDDGYNNVWSNRASITYS